MRWVAYNHGFNEEGEGVKLCLDKVCVCESAAIVVTS